MGPVLHSALKRSKLAHSKRRNASDGTGGLQLMNHHQATSLSVSAALLCEPLSNDSPDGEVGVGDQALQ